jgi:hypothetical protein
MLSLFGRGLECKDLNVAEPMIMAFWFEWEGKGEREGFMLLREESWGRCVKRGFREVVFVFVESEVRCSRSFSSFGQGSEPFLLFLGVFREVWAWCFFYLCSRCRLILLLLRLLCRLFLVWIPPFLYSRAFYFFLFLLLFLFDCLKIYEFL